MAQQSDAKQDTLLVRCDEEWKQNLRVAAAHAGESMSEYVRKVVADDVEGTA